MVNTKCNNEKYFEENIRYSFNIRESSFLSFQLIFQGFVQFGSIDKVFECNLEQQ